MKRSKAFKKSLIWVVILSASTVLAIELLIWVQIQNTIRDLSIKRNEVRLSEIDAIVGLGGNIGRKQFERKLLNQNASSKSHTIAKVSNLYKSKQIKGLLDQERKSDVNSIYRKIYLNYLYFRN